MACVRGAQERKLVAAPEPVVVLSDLNQRVPRHRQLTDVYASFERVIAVGLACPTGDDAGWVRGQIDHLLAGAGVEVLDVVALSRVAGDGLRRPDHDGLVGQPVTFISAYPPKRAGPVTAFPSRWHRGASCMMVTAAQIFHRVRRPAASGLARTGGASAMRICRSSQRCKGPAAAGGRPTGGPRPAWART